MPRPREVSRTVKTTNCTVLCLNLETQTPETHVVTVSFMENKKDLLAGARKALETDTLKVVHLVKTEDSEVLYSMPESQFIALAEQKPLRKRANAGKTEGATDESHDVETEDAAD